MSQQLMHSAPKSESHRLVDFESSEIIPGFVNGTYFLVVRGTKRCLNLKITLAPKIYVSCPDYWEIEVVGHLPGGICLTAIAPFHVCIPLGGVTGSKGIRVVGATSNREHDVEGGCKASASFV